MKLITTELWVRVADGSICHLWVRGLYDVRHLEGKWTDWVLREEEKNKHSSCHVLRATMC